MYGSESRVQENGVPLRRTNKGAPVRPSARTGLNTQLQILQDKPREWLLERLHRCAPHAGYPHPLRNAARIHTQGGATLIASGALP
jgi:hypothetical protein